MGGGGRRSCEKVSKILLYILEFPINFGLKVVGGPLSASSAAPATIIL
jgi:hypothetical protein